MPRSDATQLFAILGDSEGSVLRIPVASSLQPQIRELFRHQEAIFNPPGVDRLAFDPNLRPDEESIIVIPDFQVPLNIIEALENPLSVPPLSLPNGTGTIAGLFVGELQPRRIRFQAFDRRQLLSKRGLSIILDGDTYREMSEPGLALDSSLAALIVGQDLLIRSYVRAKRVLVLESYYREATDDELTSFTTHERLHCDDLALLLEAADTRIRRKVALLSDSPIMTELSPSKAKNLAASFDLDIEVRRIKGKDKIVLPTERAALKKLLHFLNEDYYESILSGTKFVSQSKHRVNVDSA